MKHLLEMAAWSERSEAGRVALKYPDKWIHFTDIAKLGINPGLKYWDPFGIYFYPTSWIVNQSAGQYAVMKKYFYIIEIDPAATILDLNAVTVGYLMTMPFWDEFQAHFEQCHKHNRNPDYAANIIANPTAVVGKDFYDFLRSGQMVQGGASGTDRSKQTRTLRALKCDGIVDRAGIIHPQEKEQLVMFTRKYIKLVQSGVNKDNMNTEMYATLQQALNHPHVSSDTVSIKYQYVPNADAKAMKEKHNMIVCDWTYNHKIPCNLLVDLYNDTTRLTVRFGTWTMSEKIRVSMIDDKQKIVEKLSSFCISFLMTVSRKVDSVELAKTDAIIAKYPDFFNTDKTIEYGENVVYFNISTKPGANDSLLLVSQYTGYVAIHSDIYPLAKNYIGKSISDAVQEYLAAQKIQK